MARWQPDASGRLIAAALDLLEEQGYENTTVIEIAERAGLTKSTFFRHFPDKREVLFGAGTMAADGIAAAPAADDPLEAVAHALDAIGITTAAAEALERRGVPGLTARVAAELGALAWEIAYERWIDAAGDVEFTHAARHALGEVRAAVEECRA